MRRSGGSTRSGRRRGRRPCEGPGSASAKVGREMPEDVPRRDDADRHAGLDDRHVAEAADRHLVDRDRDRVVAAAGSPGRGHHLADGAVVVGPAGDLQDRVAVGEDADEGPVLGDEQAVEPLAASGRSRRRPAIRRRSVCGSRRPELVEMGAEQLAPEGRCRLRRCPTFREVGAAVLAGVVAGKLPNWQTGQIIAASPSRVLLDRPGFAGVEQPPQVAGAASRRSPGRSGS